MSPLHWSRERLKCFSAELWERMALTVPFPLTGGLQWVVGIFTYFFPAESYRFLLAEDPRGDGSLPWLVEHCQCCLIPVLTPFSIQSQTFPCLSFSRCWMKVAVRLICLQAVVKNAIPVWGTQQLKPQPVIAGWEFRYCSTPWNSLGSETTVKTWSKVILQNK